MKRRGGRRAAVAALLVFTLSIATAHAAPSATAAGTLAAQQVTQLVGAYISATEKWYSVLQGYAYDIFGAIAVIEFGWGSGLLALRGSDLSEWAVFIIRSLATISFFSMVLRYYQMFGLYFVKGMATAASNASGTAAIDPSGIIVTGFNFLSQLLQNLSWNIPTDIALIVAGVIALVVFALIAARMVLITIEGFFAINAGVILVGLGPSSWTNEFAINAIRWVLKVAVKVFVLELVAGVGQSIIMGFAKTAGGSAGASIFVILASAVVLLALVKELPDYAASLFGGHVGSSGIGIGAAAAAAGGAAGGAAMQGLGMGGATSEAAQLAAASGGGGGDAAAPGGSDVGAAGSGSGNAGGGAGPALTRGQLAARTAGILGRAAVADMRGRLEGAPGARHGTMGGRMARHIRSANTTKSDVPKLTPDP